MTDPDTDQLKALAAYMAESASDGRRRLLEEHSAAYRWLMASLLALNAGALLFLKDANAQHAIAKLAAAVAFYVGIGCALAIAKLGQKAAQAAIEPMSKMSTFWTYVAQTGELDQGTLDGLNSEMNATTRKARLAPVAGWLSFLAFTIGVFIVVADWRTSDAALTSASEGAANGH
jgi:hypothetical protein